MSLRALAEKVRTAGDTERPTWMPADDSRPYERYLNWHQAMKRQPPRNADFCYFFWVAYWKAPLHRLKKPLDMLSYVVAVLLVLSVLAGGAYQLATQLEYLVIFVSVVVVGFYLYFWCTMVAKADDYRFGSHDEVTRIDWINRQHWWVLLLINLSAPPAVVVFGIYWLCLQLHKLEIPSRCLRWLFMAHFGENGWVTYIRPWLVFPVAAVVGSIVPNPEQGASQCAAVGSAVIAVAAIVFATAGTAAYDTRSSQVIPLAPRQNMKVIDITKIPAEPRRKPNRFIRGMGDFATVAVQMIIAWKKRRCPLLVPPGTPRESKPTTE